MKLLGLTGGVGMGKSTAAEFFKRRGAAVIDTDQLARELVQPGQPALQENPRHFGPEVFSSEGTLRRDALAAIVFQDVEKRRKLESILHPLIRDRWLSQIDEWEKANGVLGVVVIPLLFETVAESHFNKIICVACSEGSRRDRLLKRGWDRVQIDRRIAAQMPVAEKISRAEFVIWTEGELSNHQRQVDYILRAITAGDLAVDLPRRS